MVNNLNDLEKLNVAFEEMEVEELQEKVEGGVRVFIPFKNFVLS